MNLFKKVIFLFLLIPMVAFANAETSSGTPPSLEDQLESLSLPGDRLPTSVARDKLYSVQNRHFALKGVSEISLGGASNFSVDSYLVSRQANLSYRYHFNDRWSLGLGTSMVFNSRSEAGERLLQMEGLLPDVAYVKFRGDLTLGVNALYGKLRLSLDRVVYFDQFVTLGAGVINTDRGTSAAAVVSAGLVFWWDKSASVRLGFKDYFYPTERRLSKAWVNDLIGTVDIGMTLGGDRT